MGSFLGFNLIIFALSMDSWIFFFFIQRESPCGKGGGVQRSAPALVERFEEGIPGEC